MALVDCPDCEAKVSPRAAACPNCGCPASEFTLTGSNEAPPPRAPEAERRATEPAPDEITFTSLDELRKKMGWQKIHFAANGYAGKKDRWLVFKRTGLTLAKLLGFCLIGALLGIFLDSTGATEQAGPAGILFGMLGWIGYEVYSEVRGIFSLRQHLLVAADRDLHIFHEFGVRGGGATMKPAVSMRLDDIGRVKYQTTFWKKLLRILTVEGEEYIILQELITRRNVLPNTTLTRLRGAADLLRYLGVQSQFNYAGAIAMSVFATFMGIVSIVGYAQNFGVLKPESEERAEALANADMKPPEAAAEDIMATGDAMAMEAEEAPVEDAMAEEPNLAVPPPPPPAQLNQIESTLVGRWVAIVDHPQACGDRSQELTFYSDGAVRDKSGITGRFRADSRTIRLQREGESRTSSLEYFWFNQDIIYIGDGSGDQMGFMRC